MERKTLGGVTHRLKGALEEAEVNRRLVMLATYDAEDLLSAIAELESLRGNHLHVTTFEQYQEDARRTLTLDPERFNQLLSVCALGLAGEAGEVIEHVKKHVGHGHDLERLKVRKELGDVLWYLAALATLCGLELGDVAKANIDKLRERYPQGFTHEASKARSA